MARARSPVETLALIGALIAAAVVALTRESTREALLQLLQRTPVVGALAVQAEIGCWATVLVHRCRTE